MKDLQNKIFSKFKIKDIFPFYVRNVNALFFSNDDLTSKKEIREHAHESHDFLDKNSIRKVINNMLAQFVSLTGTHDHELLKSQGFDEFGNRLFLRELDNYAYVQILGNKHENNFFSYQIDMEPTSYLYEMCDGIDLTFHLNHQTKHITGGFALKNFRFSDDDHHLISNFYFTNLVNTFLENEIFPLNSRSLLRALKKDENGESELQSKWKKLIQSSYETSSDENNLLEVKYILEHQERLFQKMMVILFLMVFILEQVDDYFTNKNIHELYHENLRRTVYEENVDQTMAQDLDALYENLRVHDEKSFEIVKKQKIYKYDNYTISSPTDVYEIMLREDVIFLDTQTFIKNKAISSLLSILLFPKSFGLGSANLFQMNYSLLTSLIDENIESDHLNFVDDQKEEEIIGSICEINFDYISLIKNNRIVILENNHDATKEIVEEIGYYYFWADIYLKSKIVELRDIENYVNYFFRSNEKWKLVTFRKIIRDLHDLEFSENDHFYGIQKIKSIVSHIGAQTTYHQSLDALLLKVKNEDEIYKRQTERMSIIVAFMVALMIGYIDFFACIYSVSPCSFSNVDWGWILSSVITGTVFAFFNLCILLTTLAYLLLSRGKMKEIENRRDSSIYFNYGINAILHEDEKLIGDNREESKKKRHEASFTRFKR